MVKAVLFDLDGTLLDTAPLILESFKHTCQVHLGKELPPQELMAMFGKPLREQLERLAPGQGDAMVSTYRRHNWDHHQAFVKPFPGVVEVLQTLARAGISMAIVTSKKKDVAILGMEVGGIYEFFPVIIAEEDVTAHKPEPEAVEKALEALGVSASEAIFVGDSPYDLLSGRAAGVRTAVVSWTSFSPDRIGEASPDFTLRTMEDLLTLCGLEGQVGPEGL